MDGDDDVADRNAHADGCVVDGENDQKAVQHPCFRKLVHKHEHGARGEGRHAGHQVDPVRVQLVGQECSPHHQRDAYGHQHQLQMAKLLCLDAQFIHGLNRLH